MLSRTALGRVGFIGELYDARSDTLSSKSLFKSSLLSDLIQTQDTSATEFTYKFTENLTDQFEILDVEADIQVGVLSGLIKVKGAGKFLSDEKKSNKNVSCSLICNIQTVTEKLFVSSNEIFSYVDITSLEEPAWTHAIVQIDWGAKCLLKLEKKFTSDSHKKEIEGALGGELSKLTKLLVDVKGKGELQYKSKISDDVDDIRIEVCADVVPGENGWPTSLEGFCKFIQEVPQLMKKVGGGKGKPLKYGMIPLSDLREKAKIHSTSEMIYKSIDESFLLSLMFVFENIDILKGKFGDFVKEIEENKKYVLVEDMSKVKEQRENLRRKESELKIMVADGLVSVRSGKKSLRDLMKEVEKFKNRNLALYEYEEFLDSKESIREKLATVKTFLKNNIIYLGRGEKVTTVINQNLNSYFVVLVISSEMEKRNSDLYKVTCYYFLTLAHQKKNDTKYIVVDLDFIERGERDGKVELKNEEMINKIENGHRNRNEEEAGNKEGKQELENITPRCFYYKGAEILSSDLYGEYLIEKNRNYAQVGEGLEIELLQKKPGNRVAVEMVCPGFQLGSCSSKKLHWHCSRCKQSLEYGFDKYFYCGCGKAPWSSYEYQCKDPKHGHLFVPADAKNVENQLQLLLPLKELNILVLGQSGVGKSTWINSIANYLHYDNFKKAQEEGPICRIPVRFPFYDRKTRKEKYVILGEDNPDEVTDIGLSATQICRTYSFLWGDRYIRLIDTPGLGDTRGLEQDKENMKNIVNHLGYLKELHGICILLKAGNNRFSSIFKYCLKELLIHLHKSAAKNIVFCFTNSRNTFYSPGQTGPILEKVLRDLDLEKEISLGPNKMFCLDNEAFLFLCTLGNEDIHYEENLIKSFAESWDISFTETIRLFQEFKSYKGHLLTETLSMVTARNRILTLTKPIVEISRTIHVNLVLIDRKKAEIQMSDETLEDLTKKLHVNEITLEPKELPYPRTVCTSSKCVKYLTYQTLDIQEIEYITKCHDHCYLNNVEPKTVNNAALRNCKAMNNGVCQVCGCGWQVHMHINFDQVRQEKVVVNKKIESKYLKEKSSKEKIQSFLMDQEIKTKKYQAELEFLLQTSSKMGKFLKDNAISVYNDAISEHLQFQIMEEENKPYKSEAEKKLLQKLKETLKHYEAEVEILEKAVKDGENETEKLSPKDILAMENKLYELELTGKQIKKFVEASRASSNIHQEYLEVPLYTKTSLKSKKKSKKWYNYIFS